MAPIFSYLDGVCVGDMPGNARFSSQVGQASGRFMGEEIPIANPPLSAEEQAVVARLTDADLQVINAAILANASNRWLKVARVVLWTEKALSDRYPSLSHIFYAQRLIRLADEGRLESQGNLEYMRFSEVRIPA